MTPRQLRDEANGPWEVERPKFIGSADLLNEWATSAFEVLQVAVASVAQTPAETTHPPDCKGWRCRAQRLLVHSNPDQWK